MRSPRNSLSASLAGESSASFSSYLARGKIAADFSLYHPSFTCLVSSSQNASHFLRLFISRYSHGKLIEINSHSLFSKWFSESGKLVQRLFGMVTEMVEDESGFVVVLIGEL